MKSSIVSSKSKIDLTKLAPLSKPRLGPVIELCAAMKDVS